MKRAVIGTRLATRRFAPLTDREVYGRSRRRLLTRIAQGRWKAPANRPDPIETLNQSHRGRVEELLPVKWGRMLASPFGFFRGAAPVMAWDLSTLPTTGIHVQMCGDAHVRNLGAFAAPDGHLVFDINDFDESMHGPFEWDIKRLATSFVLAGREAGESDRVCGDVVELLVRCYRESLEEFANMSAIHLFRYTIRRLPGNGPVQQVLQKAERATHAKTLQHITVSQRGGARRLARKPPLLYRIPASTTKQVLASLQSYRETVSEDRQLILDAYSPIDVAFKIVGTGSVGTRDYVVYCRGAAPGDALFLQVKEEPHSCYAPYLSEPDPSKHQGHRVARAQHRMQTVSDPFLGWTTVDGRDYLVRQLSDHKASVEPEELTGKALGEYATVCAELFAKAHARTGDPAVLIGYSGASSTKLDKGIRRFAIAYADQTEADHALLKRAIRQGRVKARRGI
jgi:uncharacterized protein (DUF2252 family)